MNKENYKKILLILLGLLLGFLFILMLLIIFKDKHKRPDFSGTTTPQPNILPINPIKPNNIKTNFEIKPTLSQGDCFYSSIYRSLRDKNLLKKFSDCINISYENEDNFIQNLRDLIANDESFKKEYSDMFGNIISMKTEKDFDSNFNAILRSMGDTRIVLEQFNNTNKFFSPDLKNCEDSQNCKDFIQEIQKVIRTRGTYVGQIEVYFIINLLKRCGIIANIVITDDKSQEEIKKQILEYSGENKIVIILSGVHYEYAI